MTSAATGNQNSLLRVRVARLGLGVANDVLGVDVLLIGVQVLAHPTVLAVRVANNVLEVDYLLIGVSGSALVPPSSMSG
jgi:hypothetical protein